MAIPASGIQFGPVNDTANGHYPCNVAGAADASAALQAILDDATLCPTRITLPSSGSGAGGLPGLGQRITFDSRGIYRFDSQVVIPRDKSIELNFGGAHVVNNTGKAHPLRLQGAANWPPSGALTASVCRRVLRGGLIQGGIIAEDGQKPGIEITGSAIYGSATAGGELGYGLDFGRQCYTVRVSNVDIRQCEGGIRGPGVFSDDAVIRDVTIAWSTLYPDIVIRSGGTVVEGVINLEGRQRSYLTIPHVQIYPDDSASKAGNTTNTSAVISGMSSTSGLVAGDLVSVSGAKDSGGGSYTTLYALIVSVDSSTQITLGVACERTQTGATIQRSVAVNNCTVSGLRFGGEDTSDGGPPKTCIVIGPQGSVSTAVRSRVRIRNCRPIACSNGPSATQSKHFLEINCPLQNCEIYDCDLTDGFASSPGAMFYDNPIKNAYAESYGGANNYGNVHSRIKLARYQTEDLFSNLCGWMEG